MVFVLTRYIFPVEKGRILSASMGYQFDNPRTPEEIALVKNHIGKIVNLYDQYQKKGLAAISARYNLAIAKFLTKANVHKNPPYYIEYFQKNRDKPVLDILSEIWLIVRFADHSELKEYIDNWQTIYYKITEPTKNSYIQSFDHLLSYCHLISLLTNKNDTYNGSSFLLNNNAYEIFFSSENPEISMIIDDFLNGISGLNSISQDKLWINSSQNIMTEAQKIEVLMADMFLSKDKKVRISQKQSPQQKLLHVGNLLKSAYQHLHDPKLMLLLLVSIIEYLTTRNPDTNRFNVEESISKQFKLKCGVLVYIQNRDIDLNTLSKELSDIYKQRSDIAHGNYQEDFKMERVIQSVHRLYFLIRSILTTYITDRPLFEYLKDN